MTSTLTRPPAGPPPPDPDQTSQRAAARRDGAGAGTPAVGDGRRIGTAVFGSRTVAGRTARTWVGLALGLIPLFMLVDDVRWYVVGVGAMVVTVGPAFALRLWQSHQPARVWQLLPGLVLLPIYLTAVSVPTGAYGGVIPSKATWTQLGVLHDQLVETIAKSTAPIESTPGVTLALAVLLGLGAIMVDILCTVLEAPAMVGLVLLPIYVLAGATVRQPVAWWMFVLAALGYLLMLSTTGRSSKPWGREIGRRPYGAPPSLVSGRRIGAIAIVIGTVLPLAAFGASHNLISDATHGGSGGSGSGSGTGNGTGGVAALASLKGTLTLGNPIDLMTVHVPTGTKVEPYYLRQTVLDVFTGNGWVPSSQASTSRVQAQDLPLSPPRADVNRTNFQASIEISALSGRAVTFADTTGVTGLPRGSEWDATRGTFADADVNQGDRYTVTVGQPEPSQAQLNASVSTDLPSGFPAAYLALPNNLNPLVQQQTSLITAGASNPFQIASRLVDHFTDPANGFVYSLSTANSDSSDALANFLTDKEGYCQQYAAAMAVMLRVANVPSRVVVGYTHVAPMKGVFTVTTRDAHAWVEAYLGGVGWTAFDPTPLSGSDGDRHVALPYITTDQESSSTGPTDIGNAPTVGSSDENNGVGANRNQGDSGAVAAQDTATQGGSSVWIAVVIGVGLLVIVLALIPAFVRRRVRRERLHDTGRSAPEMHLLELRDTCVDLGLPWSTARSPRQIGSWLVSLHVPADAAAPLLTAAELVRYGRTSLPVADVAALTASLGQIESGLRNGVSRRARFRARWWPRSVTDRLRASARTRVAALREAFAGRTGGGPPKAGRRRAVTGQ